MFGSKRSGRLHWPRPCMAILLLSIITCGFTGNVAGEGNDGLGVVGKNGFENIAKHQHHRAKRATLRSCREVNLDPTSVEEFNGGVKKTRQIQVQWERDQDNVKFQVTAAVPANSYIGLGFSATDDTRMAGADAIISFFKDGQPQALDHFLTEQSQCGAPVTLAGACRDTLLGGNNDVFDVSGEIVNGHNIIRFSRPIRVSGNESRFDHSLETERTFFVVIGPLSDQTVLYHNSNRSPRSSRERINVMGPDTDTCVHKDKFANRDLAVPTAPGGGWIAVEYRNVKVFNATIGPATVTKGYKSIAAQAAWGDSWYLNGLLIPRLFVVRGETYTFHVNAGFTHPMYITSSREGGRGQSTPAERAAEKVYAGVTILANGTEIPPVTGPHCEWESPDLDKAEADSKSVEDFATRLTLKCEFKNDVERASVGNNNFNWTVAAETPDLVYYQCYTHRLLGFEIQVFNAGEEQKTRNSPSFPPRGVGGETTPEPGAGTNVQIAAGNFGFFVLISLYSVFEGNFLCFAQ